MDIDTRHIPRLNTDRHAWLMYGLVRWLRPEHCVEIGAWHGFCSVHIAKALEDNGFGELTCIDDYSLPGASAVNIHNHLRDLKLGHRVRLIDGDSRKVEWPRRVDFAFIDGNHSLEGCLADCNMAIGRGARCLCIHDTVDWWGPRQYVEVFREQAQGVWDLIDCNFDGGFAVLLRRDEKGPERYGEEQFPSGAV